MEALAPIAVLAAASLFALGAGCLYFAGINRPPVASLRIKAGAPNPKGPTQVVDVARRCLTVVLDASGSSDPDDEDRGLLNYAWRIDGRAAQSDNVVRFETLGDEARATFTVAGEHTLAVVAIDPRRAASAPAEVHLRILDASPQAEILRQTAPTECGDFTIGGGIGFAARNEDIDEDATCGEMPEKFVYKWVATVPPGSKQASLVAGPCFDASPFPGLLELPKDSDGDADSRLACLIPDLPGTYNLTLRVDDGAGRRAAEEQAGGQRVSTSLVVAADRPPCMDGFIPPPGKLYLLDRALPARFEVTEVRDDLDGFPATDRTTFRWSLWHQADPVWRDLPSGAHAVDLDPLRYAVDELVRLRVQASDRVKRSTAACDGNKLLCDHATAYPGVASCFKNTLCEAWVTWETRFR